LSTEEYSYVEIVELVAVKMCAPIEEQYIVVVRVVVGAMLTFHEFLVEVEVVMWERFGNGGKWRRRGRMCSRLGR